MIARDERMFLQLRGVGDGLEPRDELGRAIGGLMACAVSAALLFLFRHFRRLHAPGPGLPRAQLAGAAALRRFLRVF